MHQSASAVGYCRCTTRWLDETEEAIQLFEIFGGYETFATREWTAAIDDVEVQSVALWPAVQEQAAAATWRIKDVQRRRKPKKRTATRAYPRRAASSLRSFLAGQGKRRTCESVH